MRRNPRPRFTGLALGAMLVALTIVLAACGSSSKPSSTGSTTAPTAKTKIVVGQKDFAGAVLLSQLYGQALAAKNFDVSYKNLGPTEVTYKALKDGSIDLYGEYQGTLLTYLGGTPSGDAAQVNADVQAKVAADKVKASSASKALDVNGFYVTKDTATKYHLSKLSDLTAVAPQLVFGGPPECETRPLCLGSTEKQLYNLKFKTVKKLDAGGPITTKALQEGSIDVGLLFTGSSVIDPSFQLLTDDKGLQPADDAIAVWRTAVESPALDAVIDAVNAKLDTAAYNEMALKIFNDKEDPPAVARTWLSDNGLT
ncbi:MAG: osmoprotectant transport system substrate-binding protein [Actinomycetota bacterium]|nr:osmoprotectant transport system substrate-binding protein [Actinomycetota bacterium]